MWGFDKTWTSLKIKEKDGQLHFVIYRPLNHSDPKQKLTPGQTSAMFKVGYVYGMPKFEEQKLSESMMLMLEFEENNVGTRNGFDYLVSKPGVKKGWSDAHMTCRLLGGNLALVESKKEQKLLNKLTKMYTTYWIAGY